TVANDNLLSLVGTISGNGVVLSTTGANNISSAGVVVINSSGSGDINLRANNLTLAAGSSITGVSGTTVILEPNSNQPIGINGSSAGDVFILSPNLLG